MLRRFAVIAATLSVALLVGPMPAMADNPNWYVEKTQFLTDQPVDSMPTDCASGRLWLASGNYDWGRTYDGSLTVQWPDMWLGAGWYTMRTCLDPKSGFYRQTSVLDPDNPAWQSNAWTQDWYDWVSPSTHTWGAYLDPLF